MDLPAIFQVEARSRRASLRVASSLIALLSLTGMLVVASPAVATEPGSIAGKVTKELGGAPIEGLQVCAQPVSGMGGGCATTNASGEYTISGLGEGSYRVIFSPSFAGGNYVTQYYNGKSNFAEATPVSVSAGVTTPGIDAKMVEGGGISGRVTKEVGGAVIEGIQVCAQPVSGMGFGNCAPTNSSGEYRISGLAIGSYKVEFKGGQICTPICKQLNYVTQYYNGRSNFSEADPVLVEAGKTQPEINAKMVEGGGIGGKVTKEVGGAPIAGLQVCANPVSGMGGNCATTNASGEYTIPGLAAGEYKVVFAPSFSGSSYATQYYNGKSNLSEADLVSVSPGPPQSGIDAKMVEGGGISGKVTKVSDNSAIEGIQVCAQPAGGGGFGGGNCASTNGSGEYTLSGLAAGEFKVEFRGGQVCNPTCKQLNYVTQYYNGKSNFGEANPVTVSPGPPQSGIDAKMVEGAKISGEVTKASDNSAIEGIQVCAQPANSGNGGNGGNCVGTDSAGKYTISGLAAGSYKVEFSGSGYCGPTCKQLNYVTQYYNGKSNLLEANPVTVSPGSPQSGIDAKMVEGGGISGKVTKVSDNSAIEGIQVCANPVSGMGGNCATTNTSGEYTISGLAAGKFRVVFSPSFAGGNYVTQYYNGKSNFLEADLVTVSLGPPHSGIDAKMESSVKPVNTAAPQLTGTAAVGETLSCSQGGWENGPAGYAYKWLRDGVEISGQTASTYKVGTADEGHALSCAVTATNAGGSASATSNELSVPAVVPAPTSTSTSTSTSPPPTTTPASGVLGATAASGSVSLAGSTITVQRSGEAQVKLACASTTTCSGKLTLTAKVTTRKGKKKQTKTQTIGTATFSIPAGKTVTIKLKLNGTGRALLSAAHGRLGATLTILKTSPAPSNTQTKSVHLAQQKATKKGKK
jgi:hypothetical protein